MPEKTMDELTPDARDERERCLALIDMLRDWLGDGYIPLRNRVMAGNDPREPEYMRDRLMP